MNHCHDSLIEVDVLYTGPPVVFLNFQGLSCGFSALNFLIICFFSS